MKKYFWVFLVLGGLVLGPANGVLASGSGQIDKELDKIVVTATKTEHTLADVPEETTVITAEEIKMQNAVNALDALRWVPGISVDWSGHASSETYMVNGAKSGFTLILIDGNRANERFPLSEIPASSIERIEIVKGANSLLYGSDAMSGVINIITKKAPDTFTASLGGTYSVRNVNRKDTSKEKVNTQDASVGFKLGSLRQLYTYKRSYTDHKGSEEDSFFGKLGLDLGESAKLGFDVKVNQHEVPSSRRTMDYQDYALYFDCSIDEYSALKTKGLFRNDEHVHHIAGKATEEDSRRDEEEIMYTRQVGDSNLVTFGYQRTGESLKISGADVFSANVYSNNLFIQDEISLTDSFVVVPALRMDYHSQWKDEWNPKLSMLWKITDTFQVRASGGTAFKAPSLGHLYKKTYFARYFGGTWVFGNPDLKPEKSRTVRLSAEKRFGRNFFSRVSVFRNDFKNGIRWHPTKEELNGKPVWKYFNSVKTMTQGIETEIKYYITDELLTALGYGFYDTENKDSKRAVDNPASHRLTPMLRYHDEHMGLTVELRGEYEHYSSADADGDRDNFILSANLSKQITDYVNLWVTGDNLFDERKNFGVEKEGLRLTFGARISW